MPLQLGSTFPFYLAPFPQRSECCSIVCSWLLVLRISCREHAVPLFEPNAWISTVPARSVARWRSACIIFFKSQFILKSVVIHLAEFYGEGVLQCLGERSSVGLSVDTSGLPKAIISPLNTRSQSSLPGLTKHQL
jgi:hypothetical protein